MASDKERWCRGMPARPGAAAESLKPSEFVIQSEFAKIGPRGTDVFLINITDCVIYSQKARASLKPGSAGTVPARVGRRASRVRVRHARSQGAAGKAAATTPTR